MRHIRRWTHESPIFKHSSQPFALGCTFLISLTCGHSPRSAIVSSLGLISLVPHHADDLHLLGSEARLPNRGQVELLAACGKTQSFVIPRRAARRGISLFLRLKQREIPQSPRRLRNDKIICFFRNLLSLSDSLLNCEKFKTDRLKS